jgi:hypothetical protein
MMIQHYVFCGYWQLLLIIVFDVSILHINVIFLLCLIDVFLIALIVFFIILITLWLLLMIELH